MAYFTVLFSDKHPKTDSYPAYLFLSDAKESGADNRNIIDDGKSQKLTTEDIKSLKEQGLKGQVHEHSYAYLHKWERIVFMSNCKYYIPQFNPNPTQCHPYTEQLCNLVTEVTETKIWVFH